MSSTPVTDWEGGTVRDNAFTTFTLCGHRPDGYRWAQRIVIENQRLDRHPPLFGRVLDHMVRDIEARL